MNTRLLWSINLLWRSTSTTRSVQRRSSSDRRSCLGSITTRGSRQGLSTRQAAPTPDPSPLSSSPFLEQVEETVRKVLASVHDDVSMTDVLDLAPQDRQSFGIAKHLDQRLKSFRRNNDCPRCWLQRAHCICSECPPLEGDGSSPLEPLVRRLFLLTHHKEICMVVDTAKIILASFPISCRLVVAGIGPEHQSSMKEMLNAIETNDSCMVLFPSEDAKTFSEMMNPESFEGKRKSIDLIVIDGTWEQARRLFKRYLADGLRQPQCICLSEEALTTLSRNEMDDGRQLRRHPIKWREVSTLTATRLLLHDMNPLGPWDTLGEYQSLADGAARRQLGTIRERKGGQ